MLDETLVVWRGEFGRTPMNEARDDRKFLGGITTSTASRSCSRAAA
ncbi:MAG TPA: DUF1501 domain-containing protein [Planctomycetota bacterium]|nr:DUF1501 domain-containing protein [Planctomycetota bacterium]